MPGLDWRHQMYPVEAGKSPGENAPKKPLCLQYQHRLFRWSKNGGLSAALNVLPATAKASSQRKGLQARILSTEEEEKLKRDQALVSAFKQQKLEKEAQKNWDLFYKRNSTNFFKDRHWTTREFEELRSCREVGWGFSWPKSSSFMMPRREIILITCRVYSQMATLGIIFQELSVLFFETGSLTRLGTHRLAWARWPVRTGEPFQNWDSKPVAPCPLFLCECQ